PRRVPSCRGCTADGPRRGREGRLALCPVKYTPSFIAYSCCAGYDGPRSGLLMRVLLVEDEPNAAHVLAKGLREQAYAVDLAADGETALLQVGTTDYDAVILDVMLPRRDGFSVCRAIRASGSPVPILMVT